jgi:hypothetical protein
MNPLGKEIVEVVPQSGYVSGADQAFLVGLGVSLPGSVEAAPEEFVTNRAHRSDRADRMIDPQVAFRGCHRCGHHRTDPSGPSVCRGESAGRRSPGSHVFRAIRSKLVRGGEEADRARQ